MFEIEEIPDDATMYRAVMYPNDYRTKTNQPNPKSICRDIDLKNEDGMSCDWGRYWVGLAETISRKPDKEGVTWEIWAFKAGKARRPAPGVKLEVIHDPIQPGEDGHTNQAHSIVRNTSGKEKDYDARAALLHCMTKL